jgi:hypothetical protein
MAANAPVADPPAGPVIRPRPLQAGEPVEVLWYRRGRLPGRFVASVDDAADTDENTALPQRCVVKVDNGWACHEGYRASCVRPAGDWKGDWCEP